MRAAIAIVFIVLAVIFIAGAVDIGGAPLFGHIDRLLGTNALMNAHHAAFFFLYTGEDAVESELERTGSRVREFQERPLGVDKKEKNRQLDEAVQ
jgi:hypothetical protein